MDPINIQLLQKALKDEDEMITKFKGDRDDSNLEIEQQRAKSNISRKTQVHEINRSLIAECARLDERCHDENVDFVTKFEKSLVGFLRKGFEDQRVYFAQQRKEERAVFNMAFTKLFHQTEAYIKNERENNDNIHMKLMKQLDELEIAHSKVKSLINFSIHEAQGRAKMNVQVTTILY